MNLIPKHTSNGRVLFVDKDAAMRQMIGVLLKGRFQVVTSKFAEEALCLMESEELFDIVLSSFTLSCMNGMEFLRRVGLKYPGTHRILMSGGGVDAYDMEQALSQGHISRIIIKPFCVVSLRDQLNDDLAAVGKSDKPVYGRTANIASILN